MLNGKRVLLIISGGIAAYKSLDLIRRLRERGAAVRCVLTEGGAQFVTPLSVAALSEDKVYGDLFLLTDESDMGHIRLSREADLIVAAPATADLLAKMATGLAGDLASAVLLAADKPVLVAPAMNTMMWRHPATQRNVQILAGWGVQRVGPRPGDLACGETGDGRMAEPLEIVAAIEAMLVPAGPLSGKRALVTSGPTFEAIDPVRYIANRSSGRQGHAIAAALARHGAGTILVAGPTALPDPAGVKTVHVETAAQMLAACEAALPVDLAVCAAAVADWRPQAPANRKLKKDGKTPVLHLAENTDILARLSAPGRTRPALVVGFAAETAADALELVTLAAAKRTRKGCDWMLANDVSIAAGTFGGEANTVHLIDAAGVEHWPRLDKDAVGERLAARIGKYFSPGPGAAA